jgi:ribosomal protein L27
MGVPGQAVKYRADNKLYCLNSGQVSFYHTPTHLYKRPHTPPSLSL